MTIRAVWYLVAIWCAGLLAGQALSLPLRWLILLSGTLGVLLTGRFRFQKRLAAALLLFLLASLWSARLEIGFNTGAPQESEEIKQGLRNPHFRPLIFLAARDTVRAGPPEHLLAERPAWASEPVWAMAQALLLNRREALSPDWISAFRSAGAAHLMAVSGLHIGILLGIFLAILRMLQIRRRAIAISTMGAVWVYILLIGAPPSAVRAGLMVTVGLGMWGAGRLPQPGRLLPVAVLAALVVRPSLLASVGFQLSVAAVAGIGLGLRGFRARNLETAGGRIIAFLRVSLGAQAGVLPVQIITFGTYITLAPLVNVIAVPLLGIWLPSVVAALGLGLLGGPAAVVAGAFCEGVGRLLLWWIHLWASHPGILVPVPAWVAVVAVAGLVGWMVGGRGRLLALACLTALVWIPAFETGRPRITFLDIGQGDAIVIETRNPKRVVIVDAGPAFKDWSAGRTVVAPYLRARAVRRIDLLVASHPDNDHIGGMSALVDDYPVLCFFRGQWYNTDTRSAYQLQYRLDTSGVKTLALEAGDRIELGDNSWIDVLAGTNSSAGRGDKIPLSSNNRSLVLRLNLEGLTVLLCGDLERGGERKLVHFWRYLPCRVLKVPHHGGENGLSAELLEAVRPSLAVISVGAGNRYGHPSPQILARLREAGVSVWRTDLSGALVMQSGR